MEPKGKKYEFTGETREFVYQYDGSLRPGGTVLLHRIRALRDIDRFFIFEKDEGGWIESEANLSQNGDCWVGGDACVFGDAVVKDNAFVGEYAVVKGNAVVCGDSEVTDYAKVGGEAVVSEDASVTCDARVYAHVTLAGKVNVAGTADISESMMQNRGRQRATISGDFTIQGYIVQSDVGSGWISMAVGDKDFWADEGDDGNGDDDIYDDELWDGDTEDEDYE